MNSHEKLNYIEFHSANLGATKQFFAAAFGWGFTDYGPDYCDFSGAGLSGGFFSSPNMAHTAQGAPLVIFFSENLEATEAKIIAAGGVISRAIKTFPGGRRFHFTEPGGNELGVWSDVDLDGKKIA